ncbi:MAG: hypothetical protein HDT18_04080 [Oscillibacter sp.]|nr:hypothetical protein [Oscillibacter sp.]
MWKKRWPLLLACILLFALTACSEDSGEENIQQDRPQASEAAPEPQSGDVRLQAYYSTFAPLADAGTITGIARIENCLLIGGERNGAPILGLALYTLDGSGRATVFSSASVDLDDPEAEDEAALYGVTTDGESFYVLTGQPIDERRYQGDMAVLRYAADGQFQDKRRLSLGPAAKPEGFSVSESGQVVLYTLEPSADSYGNKYVYAASVYSAEGELTVRQTLEGRTLFGWAVRDGGVVLSGYGRSTAGFYTRMDLETGALTELEVVQPEGGPDPGVCSYTSCQGLNGEYIIGGLDKFISYDLDSGACELLFDTDEAGIPQTLFTMALGPACRLDENTFICCNGTNQVVVLGKEEKVYQERSVVTVALIDIAEVYEGQTYIYPMTEDHVKEANQASTEYEYQAVHYNLHELDRLRADILAGDSPDLVLYTDSEHFPGIQTDSDLFDDLYAYIDADETLSREDFLPNLLEAMSLNGELHRIWSGTRIYTLSAPSSAVGGGRGMTVADYNRIAAENDAYQTRFSYGLGGVEALNWLACGGMFFVDKENGTCSLDSREFRDLLTWCADTESDMALSRQMEGRVDGLLQWTEIGLEEISRFKAWLGEDGVFVGLPNGGDGLHSYICSGGAMAIPARSGNKEGAWAFIRNRLSIERQASLSALPVIREAIGLSSYYNGATDYAREQLDKLLEATKYAAGYSDHFIWQIIQEVGGAYLAGDKSLDEAIELIQSRASLWMAEQYG